MRHALPIGRRGAAAICLVLGVGLAIAAQRPANSQAMEGSSAMDPEVKAVIDQLEASGKSWVRGDASDFAEHASRSDDFSIMGPFGGPPVIGWERYAAVAPRVASQFTGGESRTEVLSTHRSGDLMVLVQIEHQKVLFAGDSEAQDWSLRVTQVYRREGGAWRVVHRHADPLVALRTLDEAKEIARHRSTAAPPGS